MPSSTACDAEAGGKSRPARDPLTGVVRIVGVKRVTFLAVLTLLAVTGASASSGRTLRGEGLTLSLPAGWRGLVGGGGVQAADFPLVPRVRNSANLVRVRHGHVHVIVSNYGPWVPYLSDFRRARSPLAFGRRDVKWAEFEGFRADYFVHSDVLLGGDMLDVLADLGPKPLAPSALRKVNALLSTLHVLPSRVVPPRHRRLAADGVAVRLLPGWSGRMEIPAERYGARLVLRATRGAVHVTVLEYAESYASGRHLALPVVLTRRDILRRPPKLLARLVFSNGGRSFDVTATARTPRDLRTANSLLATLTVALLPWTFRCCNLALRLPGSWRAALRPRRYPVIKLRGPGLLVILTELRPGERATGRILRKASRRFRVEVTPASARAAADRVLATLRIRP